MWRWRRRREDRAMRWQWIRLGAAATGLLALTLATMAGATVKIAVIRHLATGRKHPAGTFFLNAGGPAAQIAGFVASYAAFPAALRARFNIVTFDERGYGLSSTVQCFPDAAAENKLLAGLPEGFPVGARQDSAWERTWARFGAACARHGGRLIQHDSSADDARDMNLLRQAIGVPRLNYVGISYGTGLGAVYANLFPAAVGHMVLDGNLNPVTWNEGGRLPDALREGADLATASVMRSFLNLCGKATTTACAFSAGTPAATRAKYRSLLQRLLRHPVTTGTPPQTFTYADAINDVPLGYLYFPREWPTGADLLQQLWAASSVGHTPTADGAAARTVSRPATAPAAAYAGQEQGFAQFCADVADAHRTRAWAAAARLARARSGGIGVGYTWQEEQCAAWPTSASQDRYTGPWNRRTASPILVIGNTGDPLTPVSQCGRDGPRPGSRTAADRQRVRAHRDPQPGRVRHELPDPLPDNRCAAAGRSHLPADHATV